MPPICWVARFWTLSTRISAPKSNGGGRRCWKPVGQARCSRSGSAARTVESLTPSLWESLLYGGKRAILNSFRDITEHRRQAEALRQSREQLRQRAEELETIMGGAP